MPLPTNLENAQQAKERANERSTKSFDFVGILCPACNEPATVCEPDPNEYIHNDEDGTYGNDRAAYEFSPAKLHEVDPDNPWDVIHVVPERIETDAGHQLRVTAYKHDHSTEGYQAWKREQDALEDVEQRAAENQGLGDFA
jgi:hypothetical protein